MKAILLAGGRGTRMGGLTDDTPKPLVRVGGRMLIERVIEKLASAGFTNVVLSVGYLSQQFELALGDGSRWGAQFHYSIEDTPRGTGGAMALAAQQFVSPEDQVLVVNADLISDHSLHEQYDFHLHRKADVTLHVREVDDPRRFGVVRFGSDWRVTDFVEKPAIESPEWINAGTYLVRGDVLLNMPQRYPLSWEREALPDLIAAGARVFAYQENVYFRDVGTPADVGAAEREGR